MSTKSFLLTIEQSSDEELWGRLLYEGNLIVDHAKNLDKLQKKFAKLLYDFHEVDPKKAKFEIAYDLTSVFKAHDVLNITAVANQAGINPSLMRQYASGSKHPSPEKVKAIEGAIHNIAKNLSQIKLSTRGSSRGRKKELA